MTKNLTQQVLKKDENGKPILKLTPLEKTAIHTPTQVIFDELMRVCECGGLMLGDKLPTTQSKVWELYMGGEICIEINEGKLEWSHINYYQNEGYKITSLDKFYEIQGIAMGRIIEVNKWFGK